MSFAERLKIVREGMGLSLEKFAQLGGVQARTQIYYEKAERYPTVEYLLKLSDVGVDVAYLVTGSLSQTDLTKDEHELLTAYKSSSSEKKYALMLMARAVEKKADSEDDDNDVEKQSSSEPNVITEAKKNKREDISSYKVADRIRNAHCLMKATPFLLAITFTICLSLILIGNYGYFLSEDLFIANILSLVSFFIISIAMIGIGIIHAEKILNIKDSNAVRIRQITTLFKN